MKRVWGLIPAIAMLAAAPAARAFLQAPLTPAAGGLTGAVTRLGTNEPLSKAIVEIRGPQNAETTTEGDGKFFFPDLKPGSYRIRVRRDGYWPAEFGQRWVDGPGQPFAVTAGQRVNDVTLVMTPASVISGRISNRAGQPVAGARVRAMKPTVRENQRALRVIQEAIANDLGEYRLAGLVPGRYYVSATVVDGTPAGAAALVQNPDAAAGEAGASRSTPRPVTSKPTANGLAEDEIFAPIFFPAAADGRNALAIDLEPGTEYRSADIFVFPIHTYHVRGRVTNLEGLPGGAPAAPQQNPAGNAPPGQGARGAAGGRGGGQNNAVRLAPLDPNGNGFTTALDPMTGAFDFAKVPPGAYAAYMYTSGLTVRAPYTIEIFSGDLDSVFLDVTPGVDIPVRVVFDGEPPNGLPNVSSLGVTLWRDPTLMGAPAIPVSGGEAAIKNLSMGDYRVYINPLLPPLNGIEPAARTNWPNAYVKSIRFGDDDVLNGGLHLNDRSENVISLLARAANPAGEAVAPADPSTAPKRDIALEIVVGANPGAIEGQVVNDNHEPVPSVMVTLLAEMPANRILRTDMYRVTSSDTAGKFQIQGLPPGDYKVFAWEGVERGVWLDPGFTMPFEGFGKVVHIEERGTEKVELSPIRTK